MGESDLQEVYINDDKKCPEDVDNEDQEPTTDLLKALVQSFLERDKVHDALNACINAYSSKVVDSTCLKVFVDGLIERARENLNKSVTFNKNSFVCAICLDVIADPVTLKCGHTFSKKCILSGPRSDTIVCQKCGKCHSYEYVDQLRNNVTISALIEKFSPTHNMYRMGNPQIATSGITSVLETHKNSTVDQQDSLISTFEDNSSALQTTSPLAYLGKGDFLVNLENYEEAIKSYLISFALDANIVQAKDKAIELLHNILRKCQSKHKKKDLNKCTHLVKSSSTSNKKRESSTVCHVAENVIFPFEKSVISSSTEKGPEDWKLNYMNETTKSSRLHILLDNFCKAMDDLTAFQDEGFMKEQSHGIDVSSLDKRDFECALCIRILWEPVSTPCGHTFCRVCLYRCFDHQPTCPLCKTSLTNFLAERVQSTTELVELAVKCLYPKDYADRKAIYEKEMEELSNAGKGPEHVVPLFVCTVAYPTVPCPLHVFEPRYRLMIRQCMESGSRQFGMVAFIDNEIAEYGTVLEIRDLRYFPDGRSVVDTIGSKRFRILRKGERDGYSTGAVEFLKDEPLGDINLQDLEELHELVYNISQGWFMRLPGSTKQEILHHFGPMPEVESNYTSSPDGPSWFWWMLAVLPIESKSQLAILSMTSLPRRLETLHRVLLHLESTIV